MSEKSFDFIIVGGGTSGCALAKRLAEHFSVAVIEAGPASPPYLTNIPSAFMEYMQSSIDWNYQTIPQAALSNRKLIWPRGRVMGGCSVINAMLYVRGNAADFDNWANNYGCVGWSYDECLPYFKKSEQCHLESKENSFHGIDGELHVSTTTNGTPNPLTFHFVNACDSVGIPKNIDINGSSQIGASISQVTLHKFSSNETMTYNGRRCTTKNAFLDSTNAKANLHIFDKKIVTCVMVKNGECKGVKMYDIVGKYETTVNCTREVILSAGAIGSPQILMLSGFGPKDHLSSLGIPVVADLPVGKNLQDHIFVPCVFEDLSQRSYITEPSIANILKLASEAAKYMINGTGMLATCVAEAMAFIKSELGVSEIAPDLQLHFAPANINTKLVNATGLGPEAAPLSVPKKLPPHHVCVFVTLLHAKSIGSISLKSTNPLDYPLIDPNYCSNPDDFKILSDGMKITRSIMQSKVFSGIIGKEVLIDGITVDLSTEEYLHEYIKRTALTLFHPVGTCRMGKKDDVNSVVCPELIVKGTNNLRVCDASIMPVITSGNTAAPTIMIAEKCADMVLKRYLTT